MKFLRFTENCGKYFFNNLSIFLFICPCLATTYIYCICYRLDIQLNVRSILDVDVISKGH